MGPSSSAPTIELVGLSMSYESHQTTCTEFPSPSHASPIEMARESIFVQTTDTIVEQNALAASLNKEKKNIMKEEKVPCNFLQGKMDLVEVLKRQNADMFALRTENDSLQRVLEDSITASAPEKKLKSGKHYLLI